MIKDRYKVYYRMRNGSIIAIRNDEQFDDSDGYWITVGNGAKLFIDIDGKAHGCEGAFEGQTFYCGEQKWIMEKHLSEALRGFGTSYERQAQKMMKECVNGTSISIGNKVFIKQNKEWIDEQKQKSNSQQILSECLEMWKTKHLTANVAMVGFDKPQPKVQMVEASEKEKADFASKCTSNSTFKRAIDRATVGTQIRINGKIYTKQIDGDLADETGKKCSVHISKSDKIELIAKGEWKLPAIPNRNINTQSVPIEVLNFTQFSNKYCKGMTSEGFVLAKYMTVHGNGLRTGSELAKKYIGAIRLYTGDAHYHNLRAYETTGTESSKWNYRQLYRDLNDFIDRMPKTQGVLYRGLGMTKQELAGISKGSIINLNGISSFTSDKNVANIFASMREDNGRVPVIFQTDDGPHNACSLSPFSNAETNESEFLMHSESHFEVEQIEEQHTESGSIYYVVHIRDNDE